MTAWELIAVIGDDPDAETPNWLVNGALILFAVLLGVGTIYHLVSTLRQKDGLQRLTREVLEVTIAYLAALGAIYVLRDIFNFSLDKTGLYNRRGTSTPPCIAVPRPRRRRQGGGARRVKRHSRGGISLLRV